MIKTIEKIEKLIKQGIIISEKAVELKKNNNQSIDLSTLKATKEEAEEIKTRLLKLPNKPNKKNDKMTSTALLGMLGYKPFINSVCNLVNKYNCWRNNIKKTKLNKIEDSFLVEPDSVCFSNSVESEIESQKTLENIFKETKIKLKKLREIKSSLSDEKLEEEDNIKVILSSEEIDFNDEKAKIVVGKKNCQLPPFMNEHFFCRAMFEYLPEEFVDWSTIYEKMDSKEPDNKIKNKRTVQDTMYAVNDRVKETIKTDESLFTWKEKSIKRNY